MFLIDPNKGVPGGFRFYCPKLGRWFFKNNYTSLYTSVRKARKQSGHKFNRLHIEIQKFLCQHIDPKIAKDFCTDVEGSLPLSRAINPRRGGCCGGGQVK